jgi:hypothetical protein
MYALILGSGRLHVMYVRNLSIGQVPWSCIYAVTQGSCHKHVCKESFKQSDMLKCYLHIHTYEQPFACCVCKKTFGQSHNLKLCLHTHNGECPFMCAVCKKSSRSQCLEDAFTHSYWSVTIYLWFL